MSELNFLYHSLEYNKYTFFIKLWKLGITRVAESSRQLLKKVISMLVAFSLTFKGRRGDSVLPSQSTRRTE